MFHCIWQNKCCQYVLATAFAKANTNVVSSPPQQIVLPRERSRVSAVAEGPWLPARDTQGRQRLHDRQAWRPDIAIADAWEGNELGRSLVEKIKKDLGLK